MELISKAALETAFEDDQPDADVWIGNPLAFGGESEMVPFRYMSHRYVMFFQDIDDAVGSPDFRDELLANFADGFVPDRQGRIMKFLRADAASVEEAFDPDLWKMARSAATWHFLRLLREVVEIHVLTFPDVREYFYAAASDRLQRCYNRIYRMLPPESCLTGFVKIEESIGSYHGYQRKESVRRASSPR